MSYDSLRPSPSQASSHSRGGLRSFGRIPVIGFILRWVADIVRLPILHRHLAYHIELLRHQSRELDFATKSLKNLQDQFHDELHASCALQSSLQDQLDKAASRSKIAETTLSRLGQITDTAVSDLKNLSIDLAELRMETSEHVAKVITPLALLTQQVAQLEKSYNSVRHAVDSDKAIHDTRANSANAHLSSIDSRLDNIDTAGQRLRYELLNASSELKELVALSAAWDKATNIVLSAASIFEDRYGTDYSQQLGRLLTLCENSSNNQQNDEVTQDDEPTDEPPAAMPTPLEIELPPISSVMAPAASRANISCYVGDNRVLTAITRNLLLLCSSNDLQLMPAILTTGVWEPSTTALLERLVPAGGSYLEIGANIGYFTALAATYVGHYGWVYAFEPNPDAFRLLQQNLRLNRLTYIATLRQSAVAETAGKRTMNSFASNLPSSTLSKLTPAILAEMGEASTVIEIDCTTLDEEFLNSDKKFDFVKIDAEGSEPLILLGAKAFMERNLRPDAIMLLEWNPPAMRGLGADGAAMLATFLENGFSVFRTLSDNDVSAVRTIYDLDQWNLVDLLITRAVSALRSKGFNIV